MPSSVLQERSEDRLTTRQQQVASARPVIARLGGLHRVGRGVLGLVVLASVWELLPRSGLVDSYFLPPLHIVLLAWWDMLLDGELARHLRASLTRSGIGFALALVTAVPLGAAIAWYRFVREVFTPALEIFRNTAALALLPVFTLLLGIGETSKIAIVMYAAFFPILLSTISGVASVDEQLIRTARVLGLSPIATFRKIMFPAAVPTIFTGIRISGAAAILVLIAAELVGATSGLGFLINYAQVNFQIPTMYAAIITTTAVGLAVNQLLVTLERRFSRWRA